MSSLDTLRGLRTSAPMFRYAAAAAVMLVALGVCIVSEARLHHATSAPLFAAVILIAWLFGLGPAMLAAALGGTALRYLDDSAVGRHLDGRDLQWLLLFLVTVLAMAWLTSRVRRLEDARSQLLARERAARAEAEAASRAKDRFLAFVSHELKTPLSAILGWLHLLRTDRLRPDQIPHALETIERNTRLQATLIADLLDVARAAGGKMDITMREVDVSEVVRDVIDSHQPQADAGGVTLASQSDGATTILGDAERLQQVISNLVLNAMKFTPAGGHVEVAATREAGVARIVVHDTGEGIDSAVLPHIFEAFRQGEPGLRRPEGLGLGLAISKYIVEMHGGTIRAESAGPGCGATFIVELPLAA
jgi:signal transduction histidine kinase